MLIQTSKVEAPQAMHMEVKGSGVDGLLSSTFDRARTNWHLSIISFLMWLSRSCVCYEATYDFFFHIILKSRKCCDLMSYLVIKTCLSAPMWRTGSCDITTHCNNPMWKSFSFKRWRGSTGKRRAMNFSSNRIKISSKQWYSQQSMSI
jgi:hypothetical protein